MFNPTEIEILTILVEREIEDFQDEDEEPDYLGDLKKILEKLQSA